jgi:hypothetical protein
MHLFCDPPDFAGLFPLHGGLFPAGFPGGFCKKCFKKIFTDADVPPSGAYQQV